MHRPTPGLHLPRRVALLLALTIFLAGCLPVTPRPAAALLLPTVTPTPAVRPSLGTPLAPAIRLPTPTATPDPYAGLTIADLAARSYGDGEFREVELLGVTDAFTRTLVSYSSNGLAVFGFMNVPLGNGPFPVVVVNHGYVEPSVYRTLTYTTRYADALARAGFLTIHPNFRGYGLSEDGPNEFRVGYTADVLNLVALVERLGGQPGPLAAADPGHIGLWGHSMGGGVSLKAVTASPAPDAVVLYGSMSGDEQRNHEQIYNVFTNRTGGLYDPDNPPSAADLARLSPLAHLERVTAPVSIHHGTLDDQVPFWWSEDLCAQLQALGKKVECFAYEGQPHIFVGEADALFLQRTVAFFDQHLRAGGGE